ncbi:hypothetical protein R70006_06222 [Paraburkholderia domus]|uniref:hypothetical protein n=1 Tax=Paraburkholderia domus TaxID=2793075 RepID=UPI0019128E8C|nr:hypothetical protein [Paraburkholderia domus]MBK5052853.1 hypothetical protein [Burkholderia sp. R-70006]CAE6821517.1 hypothetical protein R70006_06222 [Paraburkholderia domus]
MSMKKMAASGNLKKVDKYRAPLGLINTRDDNIRVESKENREHIQSIFQSLMKQFETDLEASTEEGPRYGSMQLKKGVRLCVHDLIVNVDENDIISTIDGNCSIRALRLCRDAGVIDDRFLADVVPCSIEQGDTIIAAMLRHGMAKQPSPLEWALGWKQLRDGVDGCDPWSIHRIADHFHRSMVNVRELLRLADADPRIHQLICDDDVSSSTAMEMIKLYGDEAYDMLTLGKQEATQTGKARVTSGVFNGRALPGKIVAGVIQSVETFASRLDNTVRRELAELENLAPEQLQGRTVAIDAQILIDLVKAGGQIRDEKAKQEDRAREAQQAATQASLVE